MIVFKNLNSTYSGPGPERLTHFSKFLEIFKNKSGLFERFDMTIYDSINRVRPGTWALNKILFTIRQKNAFIYDDYSYQFAMQFAINNRISLFQRQNTLV